MFTNNDGALLGWLLFIMVVIAGIGKLATLGKPSPAPKVPWTPERAEQLRLAEEAERERRTGWAPDPDENDDRRARRLEARNQAWAKQEQEYEEDQDRRRQEQQDEDDDKQRQDWLDS